VTIELSSTKVCEKRFIAYQRSYHLAKIQHKQIIWYKKERLPHQDINHLTLRQLSNPDIDYNFHLHRSPHARNRLNPTSILSNVLGDLLSLLALHGSRCRLNLEDTAVSIRALATW